MQSGSEENIGKVWFEGTIAGMEGAVRFDFDAETGKLTDMLYSFKTKGDKDSVDNDYETLKRSLIRKYGTPIGNTGGTLELITGPAIDNGMLINSIYKMIEGDGNYRDYDEWVVKSNGYNVKIDLFSYYYRTKDYDYSYGNNLSYHYYTDADYEKALTEKQEENAAVDNDL